MKTREQVITEFKKDMGVKTSYTLTDDENYFVDKIVEAYGLVKESDSLPCVSDSQFESYAAFCIELDRQGLKPIKYRDYLEIG